MKRINFISICFILIAVSLHAEEAKSFGLWVKFDGYGQQMSNEVQRAKILTASTNLFPIVGRSIMEAYLWQQLYNPNLWEETTTGHIWILLYSNSSKNMFGREYASYANDAQWLADMRRELKSQNPIKGGFWVWRSNPDVERKSLKALGTAEGLNQIGGAQ